MNILNGLKTRRSIRSYRTDDIDIETIKKILKAAIMAPSAHNSNPWYFIVINENLVKEDLAIEMAKKYRKDLTNDEFNEKAISRITEESIKKFTNAPVIMIACLDMRKMQQYPDKKRQEIEHYMGIQSVSAAIENLLLAAHGLGLASCWYCAPLFAQNIVRNLLEIPDEIEPLALITLGYPEKDKTIKAPPRRKISNICFINKWGEKI
ncbi:MAG: nitroreductase family protein [Candidatus Lokiarchaeota archaeon]|nr:nitroreductase family protein [Candidatus Lokiarchaeota archaeon]